MATATHGTIGEFNPECDDWVSYTERLEQYFTANDIASGQHAKRRAILLSVCGASTYQKPGNARETDREVFCAASEAGPRSPSTPTVRCRPA